MKDWQKVIAAVLAGILLGGCAPVVLKNGFEKEDLVVFMKADMFPAAARVGEAYDRSRLPNLAGYSNHLTTRVAGYSPFNHTISVNLYHLRLINLDNPRHVLAIRAILAHEMGHWILGHQADWPPCLNDRVACEIDANREAVKIMGIGWGIDRAEAIEVMHDLVARSHTDTSAKVGHDRAREFDAFRKFFGCTDATMKLCIPGNA